MFLTDRWDGDFEVLRSIVLTSLVNVLEEIPRVTADGAKELIQRFGSIGAILRATSGDPQDVESAGGVVDVSCVQEAVEDTAIPDLDRLLEEVDQMRARKRKSA
jgi:DNA integrity scanning protein DisA with diadenylate cyclase activity